MNDNTKKPLKIKKGGVQPKIKAIDLKEKN